MTWQKIKVTLDSHESYFWGKNMNHPRFWEFHQGKMAYYAMKKPSQGAAGKIKALHQRCLSESTMASSSSKGKHPTKSLRHPNRWDFKVLTNHEIPPNFKNLHVFFRFQPGVLGGQNRQHLYFSWFLGPSWVGVKGHYFYITGQMLAFSFHPTFMRHNIKLVLC